MLPLDIQNLDRVILPKGDRIVVRRDLPPTETQSGLDISHIDTQLNTGIILSAGSQCKEVKAGMHIMFGRAAGTDIKLNGVSLTIMHEADCMIDLDEVRPFHDKVLVKPDPMPEKIRGIIIPDTVEDTPKCGKVIAHGPDCKDVQIGERVLMGGWAGLDITAGEEKYLIIRESDCFAGL